jgi:hypothetical protein
MSRMIKPLAEIRPGNNIRSMIGYLLVCVIGLILLAVLLVGLVKGPAHSEGRGRLPGKPPVQADTPGADEPTPDRSAIASPKQVRAAREHTPPA